MEKKAQGCGDFLKFSTPLVILTLPFGKPPGKVRVGGLWEADVYENFKSQKMTFLIARNVVRNPSLTFPSQD